MTAHEKLVIHRSIELYKEGKGITEAIEMAMKEFVEEGEKNEGTDI